MRRRGRRTMRVDVLRVESLEKRWSDRIWKGCRRMGGRAAKDACGAMPRLAYRRESRSCFRFGLASAESKVLPACSVIT